MSSIIYILQKKPSGFNSNHNKTRSLHTVLASGVGMGEAVLCVRLAGGYGRGGRSAADGRAAGARRMGARGSMGRQGAHKRMGARRKSARPGRGGEAYNELVTF